MVPVPFAARRRSPAPFAAALGLLVAVGCGTSSSGLDASAPRDAAPAPDATADAGQAADAGAPSDAAASDAAPDASSPTAHATLFVGNSYVYSNDVSGRYARLLEGFADEVSVDAVVPGGYRFEQHAADAETEGSDLHGWLQSESAPPLDVVVLQEQSMLGGFPNGRPERATSAQAALTLARLAQARGAATVLYMTWGRRDGLDEPFLPFSTFEYMQDALEEGYTTLAEHLRANGIEDVTVAPVGAGFRAVYDRIVEAGEDPLAAGSDFVALYQADGSHPSVRGAYLAACVLAGAVRGADPSSFPDDAELGADVSAALRAACATGLSQPGFQGRPLALEAGRFSPDEGRFFGELLEVSAAGDRALVSVVEPSRAEVWALVGDAWRLEGRLELPEDARPVALALHPAGDGAAVGYDVRNSDEVRVFVREADGWRLQESLLSPGGASGAGFGAALVFDPAAPRLFVGEPGAEVGGERTGAVHVFTRTATAWRATDRIWLDDFEDGDRFGAPLAVDATGARLAIGATTDAVDGIAGGTVRVLSETPSGWAQDASLEHPAPWTWAYFGARVVMSESGDRIAVGTSRGDTIELYARAAGSWSHEGTVEGAQVRFAADARLERLLLGHFEARTPPGQTGEARLLDRRDPVWSQDALLAPRAAENLARFGLAVALSADGRRAFVAAPSMFGLEATGRVHVFDLE